MKLLSSLIQVFWLRREYVPGVIFFASSIKGTIESNQGKIQSADFVEVKNSVFGGDIILKKTGGYANTCYGGNTFSPELKIVNSSGSSWEIAAQSNNVIIK